MNKPEDSLVKPSVFKGYSHKTVIYVPVDSHSRIIQKTLAKESVKNRVLPMGHLYDLRDRTVLYGCIGAPAAVLALESLVAGGAEKIFLLGFCGALCRRARLLDALVVSEALSDEGTSSHYFPEKKRFFPSVELKDRIEKTIHSKGLSLLPGAVVSTDAPYRETSSWRDCFLNSGIDGVDMETSAAFALAEFHGIQAAALLVVSDELTDLGHNSGFGHPRMEETLTNYFVPFILEKFQ
jgi:purine-nucleoside phosphorylase